MAPASQALPQFHPARLRQQQRHARCHRKRQRARHERPGQAMPFTERADGGRRQRAQPSRHVVRNSQRRRTDGGGKEFAPDNPDPVKNPVPKNAARQKRQDQRGLPCRGQQRNRARRGQQDRRPTFAAARTGPRPRQTTGTREPCPTRLMVTRNPVRLTAVKAASALRDRQHQVRRNPREQPPPAEHAKGIGQP